MTHDIINCYYKRTNAECNALRECSLPSTRRGPLCTSANTRHGGTQRNAVDTDVLSLGNRSLCRVTSCRESGASDGQHTLVFQSVPNSSRLRYSHPDATVRQTLADSVPPTPTVTYTHMVDCSKRVWRAWGRYFGARSTGQELFWRRTRELSQRPDH